MKHTNRREFLTQLLSSGACLTGAAWLNTLGYAQTRGPARVTIQQDRVRAQMDRRLLGAFLEHLGRAVYGGVYDPDSKLADANGFRKDVIEQIGGLGVPIMRYPGGNFVSGYNWLNGVGPKDKRPTVLEKAWNSIEPNQFGTNEFLEWCKLVKTEPLLATNLGTGTPEMAAALVEYCNLEKGTRWSDLRREHGYAQPHNVKYLVPGQRNGRSLADRPYAGARLRPQSPRRRAADAHRRPLDAAHRLRFEQQQHAHVPGLGPRGAGGMLRPGRRHLAASLLRQQLRNQWGHVALFVR